MGSKTTVKTNETQKNTPPEWAAPGLAELGQRITAIIPTMPGPRYEGGFVAQPTDLERGVPDSLMRTAELANSLIPQAQGAAGMNFNMPQFGGPSLESGMQGFGSYDPTAIRPVIESAMQPLMRQLTEQILPGIRSSSMESGAYGGNRAMSTLPGMAIRDTARAATELAGTLGYQDFTDQQARRLQGYGMATERGLGEAGTLTQRLAMFPDLLDTVMRMGSVQPELQAQAGGLERSFAQAAIEDALSRQDYNVRYPFQGLDVAAALLGNLAQPWGTRTTTGTQTQSTGGLAPIVGGLMGAGMMAMGMPGGGGGIASIFSRKPTMGALGGGGAAIGM